MSANEFSCVILWVHNKHDEQITKIHLKCTIMIFLTCIPNRACKPFYSVHINLCSHIYFVLVGFTIPHCYHTLYLSFSPNNFYWGSSKAIIDLVIIWIWRSCVRCQCQHLHYDYKDTKPYCCITSHQSQIIKRVYHSGVPAFQLQTELVSYETRPSIVTNAIHLDLLQSYNIYWWQCWSSLNKLWSFEHIPYSPTVNSLATRQISQSIGQALFCKNPRLNL